MTLDVWCSDIGFPDTTIKTTKARLREVIRTLGSDMEQAMNVMIGTSENFVRIKRAGTFGQIFGDTHGQEYRNFCHDAVLFYAARYVLSNKKIPLVGRA